MERFINDSILASLFEVEAINIIFKALVLILVVVFFGHMFAELFEAFRTARKQKKKVKDTVEEESKNVLGAIIVILIVLVVMFEFFIPVIAFLEAVVVWLVELGLLAISGIWEFIKENLNG